MALRPGVTRHRRAMAGIPALAVVGAGLWPWVSANLLPYPPGAVPLLRSPSGSACHRPGCGPSSTTPSAWGTAWDSCSGRRPQSGWRPARSSPSGACPPAAAPARRGSHPRPGASERPGAGSVGPSISGPRALERPSSGLSLAAPAAALPPRGVAPNRITAPRLPWRWWAPPERDQGELGAAVDRKGRARPRGLSKLEQDAEVEVSSRVGAGASATALWLLLPHQPGTGQDLLWQWFCCQRPTGGWPTRGIAGPAPSPIGLRGHAPRSGLRADRSRCVPRSSWSPCAGRSPLDWRSPQPASGQLGRKWASFPA